MTTELNATRSKYYMYTRTFNDIDKVFESTNFSESQAKIEFADVCEVLLSQVKKGQNTLLNVLFVENSNNKKIVNENIQWGVFEEFPTDLKFNIVLFYDVGNVISPYHLFGHARNLLSEGGSIIIIDSFGDSAQNGELEVADRIKDYHKSSDRSGYKCTYDAPLINPDQHCHILVFERSENKKGAYFRPYRDNDQNDINNLFKEVFEKDNSELWDWKFRYGGASPHIILAYRDQQLVAQYTGIPRKFEYIGQSLSGVQICDTMVHPEARLQMKSDGVFSSVAKIFLEEYVGKEKDFQIAYGFPNERVLRLAVRLGIYDKVTPIIRLMKDGLADRGGTRYRVDQLSDADLPSVASVWKKMKKSFYGNIIGVRDVEYIKRRFINHPKSQYLILVARSKLLRRVIGIVIISINNEKATVLDVISPKHQIQDIMNSIEGYLHAHSIQKIEIFITNGFAKLFNNNEYRKMESGIVVPRCRWQDDQHISNYSDKLFLMIGDSDLF